jgi:gas vesicle protein
MIKKSKAVALGIGVAAAGYVAGILTAPKSGKETRKDIKNTANKAMVNAEKQLKKLHSELSELIKKGEDAGKKAKGKAGEELAEATAKAKVAKQKAREILSALHDGNTSDPDLKKAIKEVSHAKKNLVRYLKK